MSSAKDLGDFINVYHLAPPDAIVEQQDVIARTFFGMRSAHDGNKTLTISPISGRLTYTDADRIWQNPRPGNLPVNASEAQQIAEDFLRDVRDRFNAQRSRTRANLSYLLPPHLSHLFSVAARAPGRPFADHWLSIFAPTLPTGLSTPHSAPVDATIELRIGPNRQPVSMSSSWRPFSGSPLRVRHIPYTGNSSSDTPRLLYKMADSEAPQTFIAPFYIATLEDKSLFWSASSYSLVIDIGQQSMGSGVQITALISDAATGPFRYAWGAWRLDDPTSGFRMLATDQQTVNLTAVGIYNVVLDVQDQSTGALARTQRVVFVPQPSQPREQFVS